MKITFVHIGREHLGIEYLSSMLKARGHTTALAYDPGIFGPEDNVLHIPFLEKLFNQRNRVLTAILESKPDLVAFSVYTGNYPWACGIARAIKSSMNIQTVFGGIHATLVPDEVIANDFVDFLVVGEGEQPLVELVDALEKRRTEFTIPNLWYKSSGSVIKNPLGPLMEKLDPLPL
ncbi:MAG: cobalamin-dependent protein, partial [Candidatus Omnitrophota bacterium]